MIVHICNDSRFINFIISEFNKINHRKNLFIVISNESTLKNILKINHVLILKPDNPLILSYCNNSIAVIMHSVQGYNTSWIYKIKKEIKVIWSSWGVGLYHSKQFRNKAFDIYEPYTKELVIKIRKPLLVKNQIIKTFPRFYSFYHFITKGYYNHQYSRLKAIKRFDFVATVIPNEFELIKKTLPVKTNIGHIEFYYGNIKTLTGNFYLKDISLGPNIILGNSAAYSNNHIDALLVLKDLNIKRKIICPLSYGDIGCEKIVVEKGKELIGRRFNACVEFLEFNKYLESIKSCSVMIMNHRRQQAMGNIIVGLYLGMRVYLNNKNPIYHYFKKTGVIVFDLHNEFINSSACLSHLSDIERNHNREILESIWGEEIVNSKFLSFINRFSK